MLYIVSILTVTGDVTFFTTPVFAAPVPAVYLGKDINKITRLV